MKKINSTAIICEYNPFHNGHLYQIKKTKEISDTVICIMSGNTVQRGGFSVADKYERAKIAIKCGADLVLEHPFPYCMSSAADFSFSGVYIANQLGVEALSFGHESDSNLLLEIADTLSSSSFKEKFEKVFKNSKENKNLSYAKAREMVLAEILGSSKAEVLRLPNNILSVEYLMNLSKYKNINPIFITRQNSYLSAKEIRQIMFSENHEISEINIHVPIKPERYLNPVLFDKTVLSSLLTTDYSETYDCDESLFNRMYYYASRVNNINDLISCVTSPAYTSSKVRRALFFNFFKVKRDLVKEPPRFTVLLGANTKGIEYIKKNKKKISIPIITRASDEKKYSLNTEKNFLPDKIFFLFLNKSYLPYNVPFILKDEN